MRLAQPYKSRPTQAAPPLSASWWPAKTVLNTACRPSSMVCARGSSSARRSAVASGRRGAEFDDEHWPVALKRLLAHQELHVLAAGPQGVDGVGRGFGIIGLGPILDLLCPRHGLLNPRLGGGQRRRLVTRGRIASEREDAKAADATLEVGLEAKACLAPASFGVEDVNARSFVHFPARALNRGAEVGRLLAAQIEIGLAQFGKAGGDGIGLLIGVLRQRREGPEAEGQGDE